MSYFFSKIREFLFGRERPHTPPRRAESEPPSAIKGSLHSRYGVPLPPPRSTMDSKYRNPSLDLNQSQPYKPQERVKLLKKANQSIHNLMRENTALKEEIKARCTHNQGVHILRDRRLRAEELHRMNRARTAFFAHPSSDLLIVEPNNWESFLAAEKKLRAISRKSNFPINSQEERISHLVRGHARATQTAFLEEEQEIEAEDKSVHEKKDLFGCEERVIHSISSEIKKPSSRKTRSPYVRNFPHSSSRDPVEQTQRDVVKAFHFSSSEEEIHEPQTEPRERNESRIELLLQTRETSATRKLLESEQRQRCLSDSRDQGRDNSEDKEVIVIPSSSEHSQEAEALEPPVEERVSQSGPTLVFSREHRNFQAPTASFAQRRELDRKLRGTFELEEEAGQRVEVGNSPENYSIRAEYGGSRHQSVAKELSNLINQEEDKEDDEKEEEAEVEQLKEDSQEQEPENEQIEQEQVKDAEPEAEVEEAQQMEEKERMEEENEGEEAEDSGEGFQVAVEGSLLSEGEESEVNQNQNHYEYEQEEEEQEQEEEEEEQEEEEKEEGSEFVGNEVSREAEELKEANVEEEVKELEQQSEDQAQQSNHEEQSTNQLSRFDTEEYNLEVPRLQIQFGTAANRSSQRSGRRSSSRKHKTDFYHPTPENRITGRGPPRKPSPPPTRRYQLRSRYGLRRIDYSQL